jgi:hypothetical protein
LASSCSNCCLLQPGDAVITGIPPRPAPRRGQSSQRARIRGPAPAERALLYLGGVRQ